MSESSSPVVTAAPAGPLATPRGFDGVRLLFAACIFVSSFLLFLVQPIIAKQILPWFGGTSGVWTTCLMFFQLLLLGGYAYSDFSIRRFGPGRQALVHGLLLAAALACLPIVPGDALRPDPQKAPIGQLLILLLATVGLPYFCLSTTGPLLQAWYVRRYPQGKVYRLFALSNGASLVALLAYPFTIEPRSSSLQQLWGWSAGFTVFVLLCATCAWASRRTPAGQVSPPAPVPAPAAQTAASTAPPSAREMTLWISLSAMGSALLLSVTNHLTQNIAAVPFLWLLPLTLYLLTFVLCFEGRGWYRRSLVTGPLVIALGMMAWGLNVRMRDIAIGVAVPIYAIGFFLCCMFLHGELSMRRPAPSHLTRFYLCLSLGGALGGLLVSVAAPLWLNSFYELPLALILTAAVMLRLLWGYLTANKAAYLLLAIAVASTALTVVMAWVFHLRQTQDSVVMVRNFYASSRVAQSEDSQGNPMRALLNGAILHGTQVQTEAQRRVPTTYYGPSSGVALAMHRRGDAPKSVGVIGLGVGTLAAYGREGDRFRFYEINPHSVEIAQRDFSYLRDSRAEQHIVLGDARQMLQAEWDHGQAGQFDLLVVDAFSSDSIPVHLITQEALALYRRHMKPGGIIAFHVSNLFLRLEPVVQGLAKDAGLQAVQIASGDKFPEKASIWVLVTDDPAFLNDPAVRRRAVPIEPVPGLRLWTDSYNNLFDILR